MCRVRVIVDSRGRMEGEAGMCDVFVALGSATRNGVTLFAKNSDRPIDDCQVLHWSPARPAVRNRLIRGGYLEIPDDGPALATLGCRPYWCWGYETGVNEAGVAGGNTAIYTRPGRLDRGTPGLSGMELLRLGLERGASAEQAVDAIIESLERFGQWGSAVPGQSHDDGSYDNAYLLADAHEAWVLETAGRHWVARRISSGSAALSNEPTIRSDMDRASEGLADLAERESWKAPGEALDFALQCGDHEGYSRQVSHLRERRSCELLEAQHGEVDAAGAMEILRDHYEGSFLGGPRFNPFLPDFMTLCMHDSPAGFTWGNTATSMIIEVPASGLPIVRASYGPPCVSALLTIPFGAPLPAELTATGTAGNDVRPASDAPPDAFADGSLWWRQRRLTDAIAKSPGDRPAIVRERFDTLERRWAGDAGMAAPIAEQVADYREMIGALEQRFSIG
jgi:secernin